MTNQRPSWLPGRGQVVELGSGASTLLAAAVRRDRRARPVISIDHGQSLVSSTEPVIPLVKRGDPVRLGTVIGTLAPAPGHCRPAVCVHWGVRLAGRYIDPALLIRGPAPSIILLPVHS